MTLECDFTPVEYLNGTYILLRNWKTLEANIGNRSKV